MQETKAYQIMFVDNRQSDDIIMRLLAEPQEQQFQFLRVSSCEDAILAVQYRQWDAILVHQHIGKLCAFELIHHIQLWNQNVPLCLVTNTFDNQLDYQVRKLGLVDYVEKQSLTSAYLCAMIENRQHRRAAGQSAVIFVQLLRIFSRFDRQSTGQRLLGQSINQATR